MTAANTYLFADYSDLKSPLPPPLSKGGARCARGDFCPTDVYRVAFPKETA